MSRFVIPPAENMPLHWETLSSYDVSDYLKLRDSFQERIKNKKKGESLESFSANLKKIEEYINRGEGDRPKRAMVCGIVFGQNKIAINIQQLKILLGKCKSSINGSLQQLGYTLLPQKVSIDQDLLDKMPFYLNTKGESKKWTIRVKKSNSNNANLSSEISRNIVHEDQTEGNATENTSDSVPHPIKYRSKNSEIIPLDF
ncbi:hypothetical protein TVAG_181650 [Trichomonas vaginalis G3]|uniref:Initiator binding domain-containing protein n=1 Tax=Trichomonas vaginalis (strain ATCC PRA-98 / G3) TaxID=412133 RepID=A2GCE8_TRIV3|nr:transcription-initiator DNA-binding domain ibd family [Trichomonas vaginalis G3]EAX85169.1 hypothetical protein TVAG_181650 [Trichomonas vaginalis G3]KAI5513968.1 transcription-initiator DNA-binding domain ibd family [Trichomonas vaginalis G3]|eukprot:XP_001298099.1 hypothetical protein [Trichomonas vaginalis G3]